MNNKFGKKLNSFREKNKVSLQKLANSLGVSKPYIWDIEKGHSKPPQNYSMLNKMTEVLNIKNDERYRFFDLAKQENDIPFDVKQLIIDNSEIIDEIRKKYKNKEIN